MISTNPLEKGVAFLRPHVKIGHVVTCPSLGGRELCGFMAGTHGDRRSQSSRIIHPHV